MINKWTPKQEAYARRVWGAKGESKYDIALDVGYSESAARSPAEKIESSLGFKSAISIIAEQSDNVACKILNEFEQRDLSTYSNKDLNSALQAIAVARSKFQPQDEMEDRGGVNRLRSVILQRIENQTINQQVREEKKEEVVAEEDF